MKCRKSWPTSESSKCHKVRACTSFKASDFLCILRYNEKVEQYATRLGCMVYIWHQFIERHLFNGLLLCYTSLHLGFGRLTQSNTLLTPQEPIFITRNRIVSVHRIQRTAIVSRPHNCTPPMSTVKPNDIRSSMLFMSSSSYFRIVVPLSCYNPILANISPTLTPGSPGTTFSQTSSLNLSASGRILQFGDGSVLSHLKSST